MMHDKYILLKPNQQNERLKVAEQERQIWGCCTKTLPHLEAFPSMERHSQCTPHVWQVHSTVLVLRHLNHKLSRQKLHKSQRSMEWNRFLFVSTRTETNTIVRFHVMYIMYSNDCSKYVLEKDTWPRLIDIFCSGNLYFAAVHLAHASSCYRKHSGRSYWFHWRALFAHHSTNSHFRSVRTVEQGALAIGTLCSQNQSSKSNFVVLLKENKEKKKSVTCGDIKASSILLPQFTARSSCTTTDI